MLRGLVLLAALIATSVAQDGAAQERVVTGLSTDNIAITATFDGSEIFVFGAIRREGPPPEDAGPLDIVLTLKGPPQPLVVRRSERVFGIWMNTAAVRIARAPSYYAIATTRSLDQILSETERLRWGIGVNQAVRRVGGHPTITDTSPFAEAVVRIKAEDGLYSNLEGEVRLAEETLFQTRFDMPANIVEGEYLAEFFLVRDQEVVDAGSTMITVQKAGFEQWIYNLAHQRPLAYAVFSIALALVAGWLAAAAFGLARR